MENSCVGPPDCRFLFLSGLLDNPELRVVLVFGYNCCKVGASNYLQRVVSTFSDMNVILAGGQVDNLASLTSEKYVCASDFCVWQEVFSGFCDLSLFFLKQV